MPLQTPPARGYAPWQRISNYDTGELYGDNTALGSNPIATPVLDVSRFAYLGGFTTLGGGQMLMALSWTLDAAATVGCGQRTIPLDTGIDLLTHRLPNLGPFVKVTWSPIVLDNNFQRKVVLFGTNRVHPLEFIPGSPTLIDLQNVAIAAGSTDFAYPSEYYAGPMQIGLYSSAGNTIATLEGLTPGGNWDILQQSPQITAGAWQTLLWVAPAGAWRLAIQKDATPGNFYAVAVPSTTGAS